MKIFSLLLTSLLFFSFTPLQKKTSKKIAPPAPTKKIFGQWVNMKYLNVLEKTKSAREAQMQVGIPFVAIDSNLVIHVIFGFHKDSPGRLKKLADGSYKIDAEDNVVSRKNVKLLKSGMLRIGSEKTADTLKPMLLTKNHEENLVLNKYIFEGVYSETSSGNEVDFLSNGIVRGLNGFTRYFVRSDYNDIGLNLDIIYFVYDTEKTDMTWKISGDTLKLYSLSCDKFLATSNSCFELKKDSLVYTLIKMKVK